MSELTKWVLVLCLLFGFPLAAFPCNVYDSNGLYLGTLIEEDDTYVTIEMKNTHWKARIEKTTGKLAGPLAPPEAMLSVFPIDRLSEVVASTPEGLVERTLFILEPNLLYACSSGPFSWDSVFFLSEQIPYDPVNDILEIDNCQGAGYSIPLSFFPDSILFFLENPAPLGQLPFRFPVSIPLFINCYSQLVPNIIKILFQD